METVRVDLTYGLAMKAGGYVDTEGFSFMIDFEDHAEDRTTPTSVTWSIGFKKYCRNRDSWVQSIVEGPSGQVWRGYRVAVPAGPDHPQYWSSGGTGSYEYGGPPTPGIEQAVAQGGHFILAIEDDTGQRWNVVSIDTLVPKVRNELLAADTVSERNATGLVMVRAAPAAPHSGRRCP